LTKDFINNGITTAGIGIKTPIMKSSIIKASILNGIIDNLPQSAAKITPN
jgi:hypothetical protein